MPNYVKCLSCGNKSTGDEIYVCKSCGHFFCSNCHGGGFMNWRCPRCDSRNWSTAGRIDSK